MIFWTSHGKVMSNFVAGSEIPSLMASYLVGLTSFSEFKYFGKFRCGHLARQMKVMYKTRIVPHFYNTDVLKPNISKLARFFPLMFCLRRLRHWDNRQ